MHVLRHLTKPSTLGSFSINLKLALVFIHSQDKSDGAIKSIFIMARVFDDTHMRCFDNGSSELASKDSFTSLKHWLTIPHRTTRQVPLAKARFNSTL